MSYPVGSFSFMSESLRPPPQWTGRLWHFQLKHPRTFQKPVSPTNSMLPSKSKLWTLSDSQGLNTKKENTSLTSSCALCLILELVTSVIKRTPPYSSYRFQKRALTSASQHVGHDPCGNLLFSEIFALLFTRAEKLQIRSNEENNLIVWREREELY